MFASKKTCGFYIAGLHAEMPDDVVEIAEEYHALLLMGRSQGKVIEWGEDGFPFLADPPPISDEVLALNERTWRDAQLLATDGVVSRHRDEMEEAQETTLTPAQYTELQAYRRALRNWPETGAFPLADHRPVAPDWLSSQLK